MDTICAGASKEHAIFYEDFESGLENWTVSNTGVNASWTPRNWSIAAKAPGLGHGKVAFGIASSSNNCNDDTNLQNGLISLASRVIPIPAGSTGNYNLAFDHCIAMDSLINGGNIRYRIEAVSGFWFLKLHLQTIVTTEFYEL